MLPRKPLPKKESASDDQASWMRAYGVYSGIGLQLVIAIVGGVFFGQWLDARWQTSPWLTLVGFLLGAGSGFYFLFRVTLWKNQTKSSPDSLSKE